VRTLSALALTLCIFMNTAMLNTPTHHRMIYKIMTPEEWATLEQAGETLGSPLDHKDGFIHFSTHTQLRGTLDIHFAGAGPLILAAIPLEALSGRDVRWEAARSGDLFPHLYGPLHRADISEHWPLSENAQGRYELPETAENP